MTIGLQKCVTLLMTVIVAVSSHLCVCTGMAAAAPVAVTDQPEPHACCKEKEKKVPEQRRDKSPCDECNSRHPVVTARTDSLSNVLITHFALTNEIPSRYVSAMPQEPLRMVFAAP